MPASVPSFVDPTEPRVPLPVWGVMLFGIKHLACLHLAVQHMLGATAEILGNWWAVPGDALAASVLLAAIFRAPDRRPVFRWIWARGRALLLLCFAVSLVALLAIHGTTLLDGMHPLFPSAVSTAALDALAMIYLVGSAGLSAVFRDWNGLPTASVSRHRPLVLALREDRANSLLERFPESGAESERSTALRTHLASQPDDAAAWHELGLTALAADRLPAALAFFQHATELDGSNPVFFSNLAEVNRRTGRHGEALRHAETAVLLRPGDARLSFNRALVLQSAGRDAEALAGYEHTLQLDPAEVGAWNNLGLLQLKLGRRQAARQCFEQALSLHPGNVEARENLRAVLAGAGV